MIQRSDVKDMYVLSPMQQGILFHVLHEDTPGIYLEQGSLMYEGTFDVDVFCKAIQAQVDRHDVFRTIFLYEKMKQPLQVVLKRRQAAVDVHDLSGLEPTMVGERLEEIRRRDRERGFDLRRDILLRYTVVRLSPRRHEIIWLYHHILMDGWCSSLLMKELFELFQEMTHGRTPQLPAPVPFSSYIKWLEKQDRNTAREYWRRYLDEYETQAVLPTRGDATDKGTRRLVWHSFSFDAATTARLQDLAADRKITMNTLFQGVWGLLLQRYNNTDDVVFGAVVAGRPPDLPDSQSIIGLFINTVPLRVESRPGESFTAFLQRLQGEFLHSRRYEFLPLAEIQALNVLRRDLLNHAVVFENYPLESGDFHGMEDGRVTETKIHLHMETNFDFLVVVLPDANLQVVFQYNAAVFGETAVRRMEGHLRHLVARVAEHPDASCDELEILTSAERQAILREWNDGSVAFPRQATLHGIIAEQARRVPDKTALIFHGASMTYRELDERGNRLAHALRKRGVRSDTIVALLLDKSLEMIVAMVAVLKAGGAYLPIDPEYPDERIRFILEDCRSPVVVGQARFRGKIPAAACWIDVDDQDALAGESTTCPPQDGTPSDLAYVIYTSGTTGRPKGVLIEHRQVVRLFFNDRHHFDFHERDVWTMFHSYNFDFSVWEMYGALLYGGTLVVIPRDTARDPRLFLDLLSEYGVTVLNQTPSAFYSLLQENLQHPDLPLRLRWIVFGGEALKPYKLRAWRRLHPRVRLINMYGITETTVHVTYKEIGDTEIENNISNIGRPIPTLTAYLLDRRGKLVPVGVPGEIHVGGEGLARGYLNRQDLTAERFIDDHPVCGCRLYRSGDLARFLENGEMEYLGRIDHQVKIRGFRIELREIESQLLQCAAVEEAVVTVFTDAAGGNSLCAYIVPRRTISVTDLRLHLAERLPDYMIPSYFVMLETLPMTVNGKVDRRALPMPEAVAEGEFVAPQDEIEKSLAEIWETLLQVRNVGIHANYFALGGDSIKAIGLTNRINECLGTDLKISDVYSAQTIAALAERIRGRGDAPPPEEAAAIEREIAALRERVAADGRLGGEVEAVYPMSDIEMGMLYYYLRHPDSGIYHDQVSARLSYREFRPDLFTRSMELMMEKHPILRTAYLVDEEAHVIFRGIRPALEFGDVSALDRDAQQRYVEELMAESRRRQFDLQVAPLWRMTMLRAGGEEVIVVWEFHHAILDGWSNANLLTEFHNTYLRLLGEEGYRPTALRSGYGDFIRQQMLLKHQRESQEYWRTELAGYRRLAFPPAGGPPVFRNHVVDLGFPLRDALTETARRFNTTLKHLCFAAYVYMLNMLSAENDIVVGVVTNSRPLCPDGDKLVGCFLNTVPLRMRMPADITWSGLVAMVDEKMVTLKRHDAMPFFEILRILGEKTQDRNPLFEDNFNYIDFYIYNEMSGEGRGNPLQSAELVAGFERTNIGFNFTVRTNVKGFDLFVGYSPAFIDDDLVQRLCRYYVHILHKFMHEPQQMAAKSHILAADEERRRILAFNPAPSVRPAGKPIHALFEEQVRRTPDRPAVLFGDESLSYERLNARANHLARVLRRHGIGPDSVVAVMARRSPHLVAAIWAVLKAGGAYLPLEPGYPRERLRFILEDSGAALLLTTAAWREEFPGMTVVDLEADHPQEEDGDPRYPVHDRHLAYIIYTSGTTGRPKGVQVEHRGLVNYVLWAAAMYVGDAALNFPFYTSLAFDLTVTSLYTPLLTGNAVVIHDDDGEILIEKVMRDKRVGVVKATPAHLKLVRHLPFPDSTVRRLIVGGEALETALALDIHNDFSGKVEICNEYGPTETVVGCMIHRFDPHTDRDATVPIGRPAENVRIYILDNQGQLLPCGVIGEICIAGDGVARGYGGRPELTRERFVADPFQVGAFMYRSGDLGRWRADGVLEYFGRSDQQVKIHGYRIEPEEIAARLREHPAVEEAVVTVKRKDGDAAAVYLCAYVVQRGNAEPGPDFKTFLAGLLPPYMIPSFFLPIPALPLTVNGKIDLDRLPDPQPASSAGFVAPRSDLENRITQVWREVLRSERIGMDDNIFELGGTSFDIMRINSKLKHLLGCDIPVVKMFQYPTVGALAGFLEQGEEAGVERQKENDAMIEHSVATLHESLHLFSGE